ncbi:hypothetical protein D3C77_529370 [compost metagenome]
MAKNSFGQLARVDVGLWLAVGVVWFQVIGIDTIIQPDRLDARVLGQQQERLFSVAVEVPVTGACIGQLISAVALCVQLT